MENVVEQTWEEICAIHNAPILAAIRHISGKIDKAKSLHQSLLQFKSSVGYYNADFDTASAIKKNILQQLDHSVLYNTPKDLYLNGMKDTYENMVDKRMPESVFGFFYNQIDGKLKAYEDDIDRWDLEIKVLRSRLW